MKSRPTCRGTVQLQLVAAVALTLLTVAPASAQQTDCYPVPPGGCAVAGGDQQPAPDEQPAPEPPETEVGGVREERPPQPAPEPDQQPAPEPPETEVGGVREERPPQPAPEPAPEPAPDEVAIAPQQLPRTGADTGVALAAALGLIGAGAYAVRRSRANRA